MRALQFSGKSAELNNNRIYNCCFLPIESWKAFPETMFLLLGGSGVGYSIQKHHVSKLPSIRHPSVRKKFIISDDIIGWAEAIKVLIRAYLDGKFLPLFDYSDVRPKGAILKTAGGKAPGPEPLKECLEKVQKILESKNNGERLETLEVHDIICHIADAVLAGGIRRAALIALFSVGDFSMLNAKGNFKVKVLEEDCINLRHYQLRVEDQTTFKQYSIVVSQEDYDSLQKSGTLPWWYFEPQRGRANNSINFIRHKIKKPVFENFWEIVKSNKSGEPGICFSNNADYGVNPCFTGDTLIVVEEKVITIKELADKSQGHLKFLTYSARLSVEFEGWIRELKPAVAFHNGNKLVVEISLSNGESFKCTPDHKLALKSGDWVEASKSAGKELEGCDCVWLSNRCIKNNSVTVTSIIEVGYEDVYDLTVSDNNSFYIVTQLNPNLSSYHSILVHNCGEVALRAYQMCNLIEVNLNTIEDQDDLNERVKAASFIGTLQAGFTDFHYLRILWKENCERDALLGISFTGIAGIDYELYDFKQAANKAIEVNIETANQLRIKPASRLTCIKPSGTSSLILGCSSGIHAWFSEYYLRRMKVNKNEDIYKYLVKSIPKLIEEDKMSPNGRDAYITIPIKAPDNAIVGDKETLQSITKRIEFFNRNWITPGHIKGDNKHNISATVYLKSEDDWDDMREWVWKNRDVSQGISILPYDDNTYTQAPHEIITKEKYEELISYLTDVDLSKIIEEEDITTRAEELACISGACEIK